MNLFLKKYFGVIVTSLILLMFFVSTFYSALKYDQDYEERQTAYMMREIEARCSPVREGSEGYCATLEQNLKDVSGAHFLDNYDGGRFYRLLAEEGISYVDGEHTYGFYGEFCMVLIFLIAFSSIYLWHTKKKKGRLKNELVRISYQKWFRNNYLMGTLIAILPVTFLVIVYFFCYVFTKTLPSSEFFPYMIHFLSLVLFSLGIYHLALIADRKSKNLFLTMIIFYALFLLFYSGHSIVRRCVSSYIGWKNYPELLDVFTFNYFQTTDFYYPLLMSMFFALLTFGLVYFCYKNKERLLMDSERN